MARLPRLGRFWWQAALVVSGGSLFAFDGCDPTVQSTLLTGFASAATGLADTLIQAFFQSLATNSNGGTDQTTTLLQSVETMARMLA